MQSTKQIESILMPQTRMFGSTNSASAVLKLRASPRAFEFKHDSLMFLDTLVGNRFQIAQIGAGPQELIQRHLVYRFNPANWSMSSGYQKFVFNFFPHHSHLVSIQEY